MGSWKSLFIKDLVLTTVITFLPFLIYLPLLFDSGEQELVIFGLKMSNRFQSQEQFIWNIMLKIIPFFLLGIWFITCRYKWRKFILIPTILYSDSLIRFTVLPEFYSVQYSMILSLISNAILLLLLVRFSRSFQRQYGDIGYELNLYSVFNFESKRIFNTADKIIRQLNERKSKDKNAKYFQNLYLLKKFLEDRYVNIRRLHFESRLKKKFQFLIIGIFMSLPVLFNLHRLIPENQKFLNLQILTIHNYGFPTIDILIWLLCVKLTFLISLSIWYITCEYWWKYAILSPIILISYQIWEMFQDVRYIDAWGNLRAFPFVLCIIATLIILSNCVKYEFKMTGLQETIARELDDLIGSRANQGQMASLKERLNALKATSGKVVDRANALKNLDALLKIREEIIRDVEINY